MADQATPTPASAPTGAGQPESGATTPGKPGAAPASTGFDPEKFSSTLVEQIRAENKKHWDALNSRQDKRFQDLERRFSPPPRTRQAPADEMDYGIDDPDTARPQPRPRTTGDDAERPTRDWARDERDAIRDFRQENENWRDTLPQIMEIAKDTDKARAFRVVGDNGEVDILASFNAIRDHLELQAYRAEKAEAAKAGQNKDRARANRDATISGSGTGTPEEVELSKMTKKEKWEWLQENFPDEFDPNDLPQDLRRKR